MAAKPAGLNAAFRPRSPWATLVVMPENEFEDAFRALPQHKNTIVRIVRGHRCSTKERLFQEWAAALQFPSYFGENWDAFEECLHDRDWLPGDVHGICITAVDVVLDEKIKFLGTFWEILRKAGENNKSPILRVTLQTDPSKETKTRKALNKFGISA